MIVPQPAAARHDSPVSVPLVVEAQFVRARLDTARYVIRTIARSSRPGTHLERVWLRCRTPGDHNEWRARITVGDTLIFLVHRYSAALTLAAMPAGMAVECGCEEKSSTVPGRLFAGFEDGTGNYRPQVEIREGLMARTAGMLHLRQARPPASVRLGLSWSPRMLESAAPPIGHMTVRP
jgi:hypothetical protein